MCQFTVTALQQYMLGARFALEKNLLVHLLPIESQIKETAVMIGALGCFCASGTEGETGIVNKVSNSSLSTKKLRT